MLVLVCACAVTAAQVLRNDLTHTSSLLLVEAPASELASSRLASLSKELGRSEAMALSYRREAVEKDGGGA